MSGVTRVLAKLEKSVEEGNYYEAHQMYLSVSQRYSQFNQRYVGSRKIADALELLSNGALTFLKFGQIGSGMDLALKFVALCEENSVGVEEKRDKVLLLLNAIPVRSEGLDDFAKAITKWSGRVGTCALGDPQFHHVLGLKYFQDKEFYAAELHLVYGTFESVQALAKMALEWEQTENCWGYFVARFLLELLALQKIKHANELVKVYTGALLALKPEFKVQDLNYQGQKVPLTRVRLLNFAWFCLYTVCQSSFDPFDSLRREYQNELKEDFMAQLMDIVAEVYWKRGPKKQPNLFDDLIKNMFMAPEPSQKQPQLPMVEEMD